MTRGAALVEALVALVIVVVLAASAGSAAVVSLRADSIAARQSRASVLLEQLLERVACGELQVESDDGEFDELAGYSWTLEVDSTDQIDLDAVTATVYWGNDDEPETLSATRWLYRGLR